MSFCPQDYTELKFPVVSFQKQTIEFFLSLRAGQPEQCVVQRVFPAIIICLRRGFTVPEERYKDRPPRERSTAIMFCEGGKNNRKLVASGGVPDDVTFLPSAKRLPVFAGLWVSASSHRDRESCSLLPQCHWFVNVSWVIRLMMK